MSIAIALEAISRRVGERLSFIEIVEVQGRLHAGLVCGRLSATSAGAPLASLGVLREHLDAPYEHGLIPVSRDGLLLGVVVAGPWASRVAARTHATALAQMAKQLRNLGTKDEAFWLCTAGGVLGSVEERPPQQVIRAAAGMHRQQDDTHTHAEGYHWQLCALQGDDSTVGSLIRRRPGRWLAMRPMSLLTPMQREVVRFTLVGATALETARELKRSPNTVRQHLKGAYERLGVACRTELTMRCLVEM